MRASDQGFVPRSELGKGEDVSSQAREAVERSGLRRLLSMEDNRSDGERP
ncbi:hypothetical protein GCM10009533_62400 [Saccharopolyspora spinosporotrichia]|uniref:Uncharacterized protein n=1 Tax=Saccharopolyspora erythraea TaxID=1836 RepID=A0ABP3NZB4_SACER